ncbi:MAG: type II toxin-antitoxin system HicB family antitoxin [Gammaproteobacteria bacterium]|nr:type II toxin-antitoxin system HicB family antitoxin [Gammaproteobacteria bacterium]
MQLAYPADVSVDEEGFYLIKFSGVHGAATDGETMEEAIDNAYECIAEAIASVMAEKEPLPLPQKPKEGQIVIPLPSDLALKASFYFLAKQSGEPNTALAKKLGMDEKEVRRMMDPYYGTKTPKLWEAIKKLGGEITVCLDVKRGRAA